MYKSRFAISCILGVAVSCGHADFESPSGERHADDEHVALFQDGDTLFRDDGSISVDGMTYESVSAFHKTAHFRTGEFSCLTQERLRGARAPTMDEFAPTDCSLSATSIEADYEPSQIFEITVVVHVIETKSGTGAISDALIHNQLEVLNEDFRAIPGTQGRDSVDTRISFKLASIDPDGQPTTGILRYEDNLWYQDPGPGLYNEMKDTINWDPTRYMNIYINDGGTSTFGYTFLPQEDAGTVDDGLVLDWQYVGRGAHFGGDYDQGHAATHEVGHYLGLFHPHEGGCGGAGSDYTTGDLIADTNRASAPVWECNPFVTPHTCESDDPRDNFMNFSVDPCRIRFTPEQANRMRCALIHYRPGVYQVIEPHIPTAEFSWILNQEMYYTQVDFTSLSTNEGGDITSYDWDFGDGTARSFEQNPIHVYAEPGFYDVTLIVRDDQDNGDIIAKRIAVGEVPVAGFSYITNGLQIAFVDESQSQFAEMIRWGWTFGDGDTSMEQNPTHRFDAPGTYMVTLDAANADNLSALHTIEVPVEIAPIADYNVVTEGLHATFFDQTENELGALTGWSWNFGDGGTSTEQNPVYEYTTGGTYDITLTVTNDLDRSGTLVRELAVNGRPTALFGYVADGLTVTYVDRSTDPDGTIVEYNWDLGDFTTSDEASPVHTYPTSGTYAVSLSVTDNAGATVTATADITVKEAGGCGCDVGRAPGSYGQGPLWVGFIALVGGFLWRRRRHTGHLCRSHRRHIQI